MRFTSILLLLGLGFPCTAATAQVAQDTTGARGAIPRANQLPVIDGKLQEYGDAFCTPIEYFHPDSLNRAAQLYYLWDDDAFYVGVRTLDRQPFAPQDLFWVGDAVEWYFDTRTAPIEGRREWGRGAVHCFFTGMTLDRIEPRFSLRPGYEDAIRAEGVKVAASRTRSGLEYELKLPWANFPDFVPDTGTTIHIDAELSYSDGISRSFRSFAFGGPLSVQQPANLARVVLVDKFEPKHWRSSGAVMMPMRVDMAWEQETAPQVTARIAMPPNRTDDVGKIVFQLTDVRGQAIKEVVAETDEMIHGDGKFMYRLATWLSEVAPPGTYHVHAVVYDPVGRELTRVAPRLVSVNMEQGY